MQVNIGGDRLGSGAKMQVDLHNYNRSTHNLRKKFQSSLAPGVLYPAYINIGLNGDKFDIDVKSIVRTLPTRGPLFGAFKMQVDCFVAPIRLYHGILHNNPINIGMKMNQVILPKFQLTSYAKKNGKIMTRQIHPANMWKYLGMSGLGRKDVATNLDKTVISRKINGVPLLAYYDIFKNYYANKQEDNAFVIKYAGQGLITEDNEPYLYNAYICPQTISDYGETCRTMVTFQTNDVQAGEWITIEGRNLLANGLPQVSILDGNGNEAVNTMTLIAARSTETRITLEVNVNTTLQYPTAVVNQDNEQEGEDPERKPNLQAFKLENIDKMRELLLGIKLGEEFNISKEARDNGISLPYIVNSQNETEDSILQPLCGLCVKTYQSDLFNNWIKTETITSDNGISEITRVSTQGGLDLDALNLAQKVYNMLNRIAVSGGTYEDWQEAVYTASTIRKAETPMYMGGYSSEIMFEEIIASTAAETQNQRDNQYLGSIGGRGKQVNDKGGNIKFTVEEPSIIMCIVSLTPRITYSQGNKWYLTDIDTLDDLHKPALDGIGYQDLLVEQMCWAGTKLKNANAGALENTIDERLSAGKTVAWINYMTDVDECYGDFADDAEKAFMVLSRDYQFDVNSTQTGLTAPTDITTYIDPSKYNYAFAYNELQAQNFWVEIQFDVTARRLMSAKQIPNL